MTVPSKASQDGSRSATNTPAKRLMELVDTPPQGIARGPGPTRSVSDTGTAGGQEHSRAFHRRQCCSDDLWIEEEKNRKKKLARAVRELNARLPEEMEKVREVSPVSVVHPHRASAVFCLHLLSLSSAPCAVSELCLLLSFPS